DDTVGQDSEHITRFLGLGYPWGPAIERAAADGDPEAVRFPRAMLDDQYDFSFSGLKTAVINHVRKHPDVGTADVAASFQAAVVDVLVAKAVAAAVEAGAESLCLGGGGAANGVVSQRLTAARAERCLRAGFPRRSG